MFIKYFFDIRVLSAVKEWWIGVTLLNVLLMLWLTYKHWWESFGIYMLWTAFMALSQGSRLWNEWYEITTLLATGWWLWHELPEESHGRQFVLAIGTVIVMTLFYSLPMPWPRYSQVLYFTRLYSTAGFFAIAIATCLLRWVEREPLALHQVLAIPWFGSVLLAGSQRGWPRWTVAIITNLIWTACLLAWLQCGRRKPAKIRSMMAN